MYPPEAENDAATAACVGCGRQFTADEYQAYVRAYNASRQTIGDTAAAKQMRASERVKAQLLAKYGGLAS